MNQEESKLERMSAVVRSVEERFEVPLLLTSLGTAHGRITTVQLDFHKLPLSLSAQKPWSAVPVFIEIYNELIEDKLRCDKLTGPEKQGLPMLVTLFGEIGAVHAGKYRAVALHTISLRTGAAYGRGASALSSLPEDPTQILAGEVSRRMAQMGTISPRDIAKLDLAGVRQISSDPLSLIPLSEFSPDDFSRPFKHAEFNRFFKAWYSLAQDKTKHRIQRVELIKECLRGLSQNSRDPENALVLASIERSSVLALGWIYESVMTQVLHDPALRTRLSPLS